MAASTMQGRISHKHDTEANWRLAVNFRPHPGELIIYDPDEYHSVPRVKIGDGINLVKDLEFLNCGITYGTADPDSNTRSQFYFKYSAE